MMPGIDGLEVCRQLKKDDLTKSIPVIMLTARGTERDVVKGFDCGADDYVPKPFSPKELNARIRAVLRRAGGDASENEKDVVRCGGLSVNPGIREVVYEGNIIELTYSEFEIILLFIKRPNWVFSRKQIMNAARGEDYLVTERAMDVQIVNLRKKLGDAGKLIKTVRGVGYKFAG